MRQHAGGVCDWPVTSCAASQWMFAQLAMQAAAYRQKTQKAPGGSAGALRAQPWPSPWVPGGHCQHPATACAGTQPAGVNCAWGPVGEPGRQASCRAFQWPTLLVWVNGCIGKVCCGSHKYGRSCQKSATVWAGDAQGGHRLQGPSICAAVRSPPPKQAGALQVALQMKVLCVGSCQTWGPGSSLQGNLESTRAVTGWLPEVHHHLHLPACRNPSVGLTLHRSRCKACPANASKLAHSRAHLVPISIHQDTCQGASQQCNCSPQHRHSQARILHAILLPCSRSRQCVDEQWAEEGQQHGQSTTHVLRSIALFVHLM